MLAVEKLLIAVAILGRPTAASQVSQRENGISLQNDKSFKDLHSETNLATTPASEMVHPLSTKMITLQEFALPDEFGNNTSFCDGASFEH